MLYFRKKKYNLNWFLFFEEDSREFHVNKERKLNVWLKVQKVLVKRGRITNEKKKKRNLHKKAISNLVPFFNETN